MLEVAIKELRKVAMDFYNITQTQIVLFDENRKHLYSYPEKHCNFCSAIRSVPELEKKCQECDNKAFDICKKTKKPYIYRCHMNLSEAMAPIVENNVLIGYIIIGQIVNDTAIESVREKTEKIIKKYNLDSSIYSYLSELQIVDNVFLYSSINMASMCACYLYSNKIIKSRSDILIYQLTDYIEKNLAKDLSIKVLCKELCISRSKLYTLSFSAFGMGISDYIISKRISKAKKLLSETTKPIYEISELVGYKDANYFVRIFKIMEGITPGKFRKKE